MRRQLSKDLQALLTGLLFVCGLGCTGPMVRLNPTGPTSQVTRVPEATQANAKPGATPALQKPVSTASTGMSAAVQTPEVVAPELVAPELPNFEQEMRCDKVVCSLSSVVPLREFTRAKHASQAPNASLWVYQIAEGSTVVFPENEAVELYALVIKGSLAASSARAETANLELWHLVQADGAGLSVSAVTNSTLVIAVVSKQGPLLQAIAESNRLRAKSAVKAGMRVFELTRVPRITWGNNRFSARLALGGESTLPSVASFGLLTADALGAIPKNVHQTEWEHLVILSGDGVMSLGAKVYPVKAGSVIQIEPGVTHDFTPSGKAPLFAVQLFAVKGPELRYLELSRLGRSGKN